LLIQLKRLIFLTNHTCIPTDVNYIEMQAPYSVSNETNPRRFDWLVIVILLFLAAGTVWLVWRGDQVEVQVIATSPADGDGRVSTTATIQVSFDQPMAVSGDDTLLRFDPPVSGTVRWDRSTLIFSPHTPLLPETTYTVALARNFQSLQGQDLATTTSWKFTTRSPELLFVAPDDAGIDQLFVIDPDAGPPVQLTQETFGVFDYQLSPDSAMVAYAALREDGGSDLWVVHVDRRERTQLLACPGAMCSGAAWTETGQRLAYEKRTLASTTGAPGPPRLWWLEIDTGETAQMFADSQMLGYGVVWSPTGEWLSYVAPGIQGVQVFRLEDGQNLVVPSRMGGLPAWSPQGDSLIVADMQGSDAGFAVHLLKATPDGGKLIDLSGEGQAVEDSSPDWSPDGNRIAFTRKVAGAAMGKQIWLMRADGGQARFLTNDTDIHHALPRWSPDGQTLAFQRFPLKKANASTSIWLLDVDSGDSRELAPGGNRPTWRP
jgi:TolB protein